VPNENRLLIGPSQGRAGLSRRPATGRRVEQAVGTDLIEDFLSAKESSGHPEGVEAMGTAIGLPLAATSPMKDSV